MPSWRSVSVTDILYPQSDEDMVRYVTWQIVCFDFDDL